jgi:hypothetical protein
MFGQNGFGDDSPQTSGLSKANKGCDQMDDENEQIAHNSSYSGQNPLQFRAKFRIRQAQDEIWADEQPQLYRLPVSFNSEEE